METPATDATNTLRKRSLRRFVCFIVFNIFLFNAMLVVLDSAIVRKHVNIDQHDTFTAAKLLFRLVQGNDSLGAMLPAVHILEQNPKAPVYDTVFFVNHTKFQYPLTSLLPYYAMQRLGISDRILSWIFKAATLGAVGLTIVFTILIAFRHLPRDCSRFERTTVAAGLGVSGLLFYPLLRGFTLGQIQSLLTLCVTVALWCWISGRERTAGWILGLTVLVKPQYGLFLLWALLRKKYGAFFAGLTCALSGLIVSCFEFGWKNNLDYLQVLSTIGRHGESFLANQSMNGLLNRLLFNGNNLTWDALSYPPYNPVVYFGTLITSVLILGVAMFWRWGAVRRGGVADLACILLAATLASPVAWEHHYALLLPILAWIWFSRYGQVMRAGESIAIALAFLLTANSIVPLAALAAIPVLNILQSYLYFGALIAMILLLRSSFVPVSPAAQETAP